ncbi:copper transporter [Desulfolucanica intricata]|uniref:copper transporter n=1 Tax=Desulfolucanica intricata TaxID=1285191 RepID=UPI000832933D|nr:copper transporter [Desulfolucanica intricata]
MIIDLKYHIASLVAVFLALGIGILIGSTMLGSDTIVKTQKQMTDNLGQQLEILREENEAIETRANKLEYNNNILNEYEKEVLPLLVANRLSGQKVAILETHSSGVSDNLKNIFKLAGAEVTSVTTITDGFDFSNDKKLPASLNLTPDLDQDKITEILAKNVAIGILSGQNNEIINNLIENEFIKTEGTYGQPINAIVIIGGSRDEHMVKLADIDLPLIDYFKESNINVYGVETSEVEISYMKDYQKKQISTVDNIDTVPGQMALILAMQGNPGHYGIKDTAQDLLPPLGVAQNGIK